jgi:hypothetical protein
MGYGYNFTFPFARRSEISGNDYGGNHQAFDFGCYLHEKITAAQVGTVTGSTWIFDDDYHYCSPEPGGNPAERGNYIILDHGGGLTTKYYQLSNEGNTPPIGTQFKQGAYMAYGDNTGCSDGNHLHFATELNGVPFNPYDDNDWVSGVPIPAGYRDHDGVVQGAFTLSNTKIRNYWTTTLEGSLGSPVGNVTSYSCSTLIPGYRQYFERGYIEYCGTGNANHYSYPVIYLPDIRYRYSMGYGYNSYIVVRNNSFDIAKVNITIYYPDGRVFDTRTHNSLAARAIWVLDVHDVISEPLMYYAEATFVGSASVSADKDVSVLVMQHKNYQSQDYTGIPETISAASGIGIAPQVYIPAYLNNYYCWDSKIYVQNAGTGETTVYAKFYDPNGNQLDEDNINGVTPGEQVTFSDLYTGDEINDIGSVKVWSSPSQKLPALVEHTCDQHGMSFEYEGISVGGAYSRAPILFKKYYNWYSSIELQNLSSTPRNVNITFNPAPNPTPTPFSLPGYGQKEIYMGTLSFPDGWKGSASVNVPNGNIVTSIHHLAGDNIEALGYHGIKNGATTLNLPYVRNHPSGEETWIASINVMNIGASEETVDVDYFDENGAWILRYSFLLGAGASEELINTSSVCGKHPEPPPCEMPHSFTGSVVLSSSTNLVAGVHLADTSSYGNHHAYSVP